MKSPKKTNPNLFLNTNTKTTTPTIVKKATKV